MDEKQQQECINIFRKKLKNRRYKIRDKIKRDKTGVAGRRR
jgi:hypothetical protein